jgi:hypothetical protein
VTRMAVYFAFSSASTDRSGSESALPVQNSPLPKAVLDNSGIGKKAPSE